MKRWIFLITLLGVGTISSAWYYHTSQENALTRYTMATAKTDTIVASVSGSGQVSAQNSIDLKPETSGKITSVRVKQAQPIHQGEVIATIDSRNASVGLSSARASLESAQANYQKILAGPSSADIAVSKSSVTSAQSSLSNAQNSYDTTIASAKTNLDNAKRGYTNIENQQKLTVKNALSSFMNTSLSADPSTLFTTIAADISGAYTGSDQGHYTVTVRSTGNGYEYNVSDLESYTGTVQRGIPLALGTRGLYLEISETGTLLDGMSWVVRVPNTRSSSYPAADNSYQTALQNQSIALSNALSAIESAQNSYDQAIMNAKNSITSAQNSLGSAQASFDLKMAKARPEDITTAHAQVLSAQAQLQQAQNTYQSTVITAPFDGTLAIFSLNVGDQVSPSTSIGTLITKQQIAKISLNEVDAAKVKIGNRATLTFDAIDNFSLTGHMVTLDTIGTVAQGVVNYSAQIALDMQDDRIKPGMSVTVAIIIDSKQNVLTLPSGAVKSRGDSHYVEVFNPPLTADTKDEIVSAQKPTQQTIEIGLSNDTLTEIISGIVEGDMVVLQTKSNTKTSATPSSNGALSIPGLNTRSGGGSGGGTFRGTTGGGTGR
ncbi:MAG: HlyD family efflux transporter periplasmic adaptor subunit [bacterium]|nr:HlyD family efflux transporter periplasmic adaptor subunit [bacterium]